MNYLIGPNGEPFKNVEYYEMADAAKHIINIYIEKDENIRKKYEEFKKDYSYFNPDIDFILCHLGYKINSPFIVDDGILEGSKEGLIYTSHPNTEDSQTYNYPRATDKDLGIKELKVKDIEASIISPSGMYFEVNREKNYIHQYLFEIIMLQLASKSKKLYEDYLEHYDENDELYYVINAYFKNRLGYIYSQKYLNNSGYIFYNNELLNDRIKGIIKNIKNIYPAMELTPSNLPSNVVTSSKNMMNEMSDIRASRRI